MVSNTYHVGVVARTVVSVEADSAEEAEQILEDYRKADMIPSWVFDNSNMIVEPARQVAVPTWHVYEKLDTDPVEF